MKKRYKILIWIILILLINKFILVKFVYQISIVKSDINDSIKNWDWVLSTKIFKNINKWDIILYEKNETFFIREVISNKKWIITVENPYSKYDFQKNNKIKPISKDDIKSKLLFKIK